MSKAYEMPRFDDEMADIQELARIMTESMTNEIMGTQAKDACTDGNQRNGYQERDLVASVGVIRVQERRNWKLKRRSNVV